MPESPLLCGREALFTGKRFRVCLSHIGEGYSGDFDESDPEDRPLLRVDVMQKGRDGGEADINEYGIISNGSYCTLIPATISLKDARRIAKHIVGIFDKCNPGKRDMERLSWISNIEEGLAYQ